MSAATLLRDVFGFDAYRPGQQEIVEAVVDGRNTLAISRRVVANPCVFNCLPWSGKG